MADELCPGFEPQTYLKDRCKRCFRLKVKHTGHSIRPTPVRRHMSWRERMYGDASNVYGSQPNDDDQIQKDVNQDHNTGVDGDAESTTSGAPKSPKSARSRRSSKGDDETMSMKTARSDSPGTRSGGGSYRFRSDDEVSSYSFVSAKSGEESTGGGSGSRGRSAMSSATSFESLTDGDGKSMTEQEEQDHDERTLPPEDDEQLVSALSDHDGSQRSSTPTELLSENDSRAFIRSIKTQLEIMEQKCSKLEAENANLRESSNSHSNYGTSSTTVVQNGTDSGEEQRIRELENRLAHAESMYQDYREENNVLKIELRELQDNMGRGTTTESKQLRDKLKAAEQLCEELMDENEQNKRDIQELQKEIEESADQYREEEIEEFRELQRELEQTAKNCRILQFKLRKVERTKEQAEADRSHLEEKLREVSAGQGITTADFTETRKARELESELRIAKEVSVRLHNELEALEDKRYKLEDECFYLKEKVRELDAREKIHDPNRGKEGRKSPAQARVEQSRDVAQLLRDLNDALERETDLRDQLKFSEEDVQGVHKKLTDLETENEGLLKQLAKFTNQGRPNKPPMIRSYSEGQAQIQLELAEHEAQVLKSKLGKVEKENESMAAKIGLLEKQVGRSGGRTSFSERELTSAVPDTYYKQKIKMLEEEMDEMKHKLEEAKRAELEAQHGQDAAWRFGERRRGKGMDHAGSKDTRSQSLDDPTTGAATGATAPHGSSPGPVDHELKKQLALSEQEATVLRQKQHELEGQVQKIAEENKRLQVLQRGNKSEVNEKVNQMQRDIDRFVAKISDLETQKADLTKQLSAAKKQAEESSKPSSKISDLQQEIQTLTASLKTEKNTVKSLESQLTDYKHAVTMTDNQKLVHMASKVEILNNQLRESEERYNTIHRRLVAPNGAANGHKYEDALRERCEQLERELAEVKSANSFRGAGAINGDVSGAELEKCCLVIETLESQVDRIYAQLEKLQANRESDISVASSVGSKASKFGGAIGGRSSAFSSPKTSGSSMKAESKAAILGDVEKLKSDLEQLMSTLQRRRNSKASDEDSAIGGGASGGTSTPVNQVPSGHGTPSNDSDAERIRSLQTKIDTQTTTIHELREQLKLVRAEAEKSTQNCAEATDRLLQTEDRWNKELDRMRESYESQVKDLKYYLAEAEQNKAEKTSILEQKTAELESKTKKVTELESQVTRLSDELRTKYTELTERIEVERKKAKEFQTKHSKLEELFESDKAKTNSEREKLKSDLSDLKKRHDDLQATNERMKEQHEEQRKAWSSERANLEGTSSRLQSELSAMEKKATRKATELASVEQKKLMEEINKAKSRYEREIERWKTDYKALQKEVDAKAKAMEMKLEDEDRYKKDIDLLKSRLSEQKIQLNETRKIRDEAREELNRWQQTWARERSELAHKLRTEEKVSQAESKTQQVRFESRLKISEETTKSLNTQLAQARRERDQYRDQLLSAQKKVTESNEKGQLNEKEWQTKLVNFEKKLEEFDDIKAQIEKLATENQQLAQEHLTEKRLWTIEKEELLSQLGRTPEDSYGAESMRDADTRLYEAMQVADSLRSQIDSLKQTHETELNEMKTNWDNYKRSARKDMMDNQKRIRELQEQVKLLEIDRRNMLSSKDSQEIERNTIQKRCDDLVQKIHDHEIHQLANKYKLDKISDKLNETLGCCKDETTDAQQTAKVMVRALEQLEVIREDMAKTKEIGRSDAASDAQIDAASVASWRSTQTGRRSNDTYNTQTAAPSRQDTIQSNDTESGQSYPVQKSASTTSKPYNYLERTDSAASETTYNNWEDRIAEIRKRSPSPSPRKMTAYPEAPPTMMLNKDKVVEYDKDGTRHWIPKQIQRSASHDPRANYSLVVPEDKLGERTSEKDDASIRTDDSAADSTKTHNRSKSSGGPHASTSAEPHEKTPPRRIPMSSPRKLFGDAMTAVKVSGASVSDRRRLFGKNKAQSLETTETAKAIGAAGLGAANAAVHTPTMQTSTESVEPKSSSRTSLVGGLVDRFRSRRSSSREPASSTLPVSTIGYRPSGYASGYSGSASPGAYSTQSLSRRTYTGVRQSSTDSASYEKEKPRPPWKR